MPGIKIVTDTNPRILLESVCAVASSQGMEYGLCGPTAIRVKKGHPLGPGLTGGELSHVDFTISVKLMPAGKVQLMIESDSVFRIQSGFKSFKSLTEEEEFINGVRHELQARGVKILKTIHF